jgi:hypothetical protein
MPDADPRRAMADQRERLRTGLLAIYRWYERNAALAACVLHDIEQHALTKEIFDLRFAAHFAAYHQVLGAKLNGEQRAMVQLALSFYTWRTLVHHGGLELAAAVDAMVQPFDCAG